MPSNKGFTDILRWIDKLRHKVNMVKSLLMLLSKEVADLETKLHVSKCPHRAGAKVVSSLEGCNCRGGCSSASSRSNHEQRKEAY